MTAMCYGEYFPSPGPLASGPQRYSRAEHERHNALVSEPAAFLAETLGTMILALVVFALTDPQRVRAGRTFGSCGDRTYGLCARSPVIRR